MRELTICNIVAEINMPYFVVLCRILYYLCNMKVKITVTVDEKIEDRVKAVSIKENRNFSNMVEVLLDEALLARIIKSKKNKDGYIA